MFKCFKRKSSRPTQKITSLTVDMNRRLPVEALIIEERRYFEAEACSRNAAKSDNGIAGVVVASLEKRELRDEGQIDEPDHISHPDRPKPGNNEQSLQLSLQRRASQILPQVGDHYSVFETGLALINHIDSDFISMENEHGKTENKYRAEARVLQAPKMATRKLAESAKGLEHNKNTRHSAKSEKTSALTRVIQAESLPLSNEADIARTTDLRSKKTTYAMPSSRAMNHPLKVFAPQSRPGKVEREGLRNPLSSERGEQAILKSNDLCREESLDFQSRVLHTPEKNQSSPSNSPRGTYLSDRISVPSDTSPSSESGIDRSCDTVLFMMKHEINVKKGRTLPPLQYSAPGSLHSFHSQRTRTEETTLPSSRSAPQMNLLTRETQVSSDSAASSVSLQPETNLSLQSPVLSVAGAGIGVGNVSQSLLLSDVSNSGSPGLLLMENITRIRYV